TSTASTSFPIALVEGMPARPRTVYKLDHLRDRETVRDHDRLAHAVAGGGQQLERATAVGRGAATRAAKWGHGVAAGVVDLVGRIPWAIVFRGRVMLAVR